MRRVISYSHDSRVQPDENSTIPQEYVNDSDSAKNAMSVNNRYKNNPEYANNFNAELIRRK
jgi:hypothetical protein